MNNAKLIEKVSKKARTKSRNEEYYHGILKSNLWFRIKRDSEMDGSIFSSQFKDDDDSSIFETVLEKETTRTSDVPLNEISDMMTSASDDETRYVLNSIMFDDQRMVSTDGRRLMTRNIDHGYCNITKNLIQRKMLKDILDLLGKKGEIHIQFKNPEDEVKNGYFYIRSGDIEFVGELIDGNYPNYRQVLPELSERQRVGQYKVIDPKGFIKLVKEINSAYGKKPTKRLLVTNGKIEIKVSEGDYDSKKKKGVEKILHKQDVTNLFDCKEITDVAVDLNYFNDFIKIGMTDFFVKDAESPLGFGKEGFYAVLMPMRRM
jgi:DNA polymerase III sliding clamp (beta) subunit (PCNA family)